MEVSTIIFGKSLDWNYGGAARHDLTKLHHKTKLLFLLVNKRASISTCMSTVALSVVWRRNSSLLYEAGMI